jgi:hypothetical protein
MQQQLFDYGLEPPPERESYEERARIEEERLDAADDERWAKTEKSLDFLMGQWRSKRSGT